MNINSEFHDLIDDILKNNDFIKLNNIPHHGITRYEHSLRVAEYTYKVTKFMHLNYIEATRAALLHDFFLDEVKDKNGFDRLQEHPKYALKNAKKHFELSPMQEDIIIKHMFPITLKIPKYFESWIVDFLDDVAAIHERLFFTKWKLLSNYNFILLVVVGMLK